MLTVMTIKHINDTTQLEATLFPSPDQQSRIHCLMISKLQLLSLNGVFL